jgi:hypothetical protein
MRKANGESGGTLAAVLTAAEAGIDVWSLQCEDLGEGVADGERAHFGGSIAGCVKRADQGAHAGSGYAVHGNVMVFKPLNDAYMRHSDS